MNSDELIERIKYADSSNVELGFASDIFVPMSALKQLAADYESLVAQTRWIPCSERLPENINSWPIEVWSVIELTAIDTKHLFYQNSKFYKNEWMDSNGDLIERNGIRVVAWKPIKPYEPRS